MARPIQFYNAGHRQRLKILKKLSIYIQLRFFAARYVRWPFICFGETEGLEMVKIHQWGPKKQTFFFVFSVFSVFSGCRVTLLNMLQTTWNNRVCVCVFSFFHKHVSIFSVMYSLPHVAGVFSTPHDFDSWSRASLICRKTFKTPKRTSESTQTFMQNQFATSREDRFLQGKLQSASHRSWSISSGTSPWS